MSTALQALSGETASEPTVIEQPEPEPSGGETQDQPEQRPPLPEEYRPETLDEVAGHENVKGKLKALQKRGLAGQAYWIDGMSGTGKTTLAWIMARRIAEDANIRQLDATELKPKQLKKVEREMGMTGLGQKTGRAYIVNEAHGLRQDTRKQLLETLERIPSHVMWIFTTTRETNEQAKLFDSGRTTAEQTKAVVGRCKHLALTRDLDELAEPLAKRAKWVAEQENLDGKPIEEYVDLCKEKDGSLRAVLQEIEMGVML